MSADRRQQLIESAVSVFAREGVSAGNTGTVAKQAGVAAGTLFNYFKSKADLVQAAYLDCKLRAAEKMRAAIVSERPASENLRAIWISAIEWHLNHAEATAFMEQVRNSPAWQSEDLSCKAAEAFAFLFEFVSEAQARGEIADLPHEYLEGVFSSLFLTTVAYMRENRLEPDDAFAERSFAVLWQAIALPAGVPSA